MKLNINEVVKVKLNGAGREIHRQWYESLCIAPYRPLKEDADGYSEWQLWELMKLFGKHIRLGCRLPFDSEIEIVEK